MRMELAAVAFVAGIVLLVGCGLVFVLRGDKTASQPPAMPTVTFTSPDLVPYGRGGGSMGRPMGMDR